MMFHVLRATMFLFMPRFVRSDSIAPQERDLELLAGLFESRVMTLPQAAALYFEGKPEATKKRVQKLKAAGYLRERPRQTYEPSVLFLTSKAFTLLSEHGHLAPYPPVPLSSLEKRANVSDLTLRHELEVMDVKAALVSALSHTESCRVVEFSTWPLLSQFRARPSNALAHGRTEVLVKPDGFMRIHQKDRGELFEHTFFLEVDRSTESQEMLAVKAASYGDYYRSGSFAVRQGGERSSYAEYPFRVLMVFRTEERRNNCAERLLLNNPPVRRQVMLTTMGEVKANPLGPIWIQPADYEEAVRSTAFEVERVSSPLATYRRQSEREKLVARSVLKHTLFTEDPT